MPSATHYEMLCDSLLERRRRWLVTGGAGFIGTHLVEQLVRLGQSVVILDNLSGGEANLREIRAELGEPFGRQVELLRGDIRNPDDCQRACQGVELVLHQAAIASVPASIEDPLTTHEVNVTGTLNLLIAARDAGVRRVVYASSSAVYGDEPSPAKVEPAVGRPLSPYAASKAICETYATTFTEAYGLDTVGLRYFNVFGPRQDPAGPYAAVIPLWIEALTRGEPIRINGDGLTTRDFIPVANVVQANLLAALAEPAETVRGEPFNVGMGDGTDLNALASQIMGRMERIFPDRRLPDPVHQDFRAGDIRHSTADITKARTLLGFAPSIRFEDGLAETVAWFANGVPAAAG